MVGDWLTTAANGYFAAASVRAELLARNRDGLMMIHPGYGEVNTSLNPQYQYGAPRQVYFGGIGVDIDGVVLSSVGSTNDDQTRIQLVQQMGTQLSALEHRILEILFADANNPGEAASTVKALSSAAAQGQTIYTIDQSNLQYLDQITTTEAIKNDIRDGVNAGMVATIHEAPIIVGSWVGTGYSMVDPRTGAGAFRIGSGSNGGELEFDEGDTSLMIIGLIFESFFWLFGFVKLIKASADLYALYSAIKSGSGVLKDCPLDDLMVRVAAILFLANIAAVVASAFAGPLASVLIPILVGIVSQVVQTLVVSGCQLAQARIYWRRHCSIETA